MSLPGTPPLDVQLHFKVMEDTRKPSAVRLCALDGDTDTPRVNATSLNTQMSTSAFCSKNRTLAANVKMLNSQTCPTCAGRGLSPGQTARPGRQTHRELKADSLFPPTTNSLGASGGEN